MIHTAGRLLHSQSVGSLGATTARRQPQPIQSFTQVLTASVRSPGTASNGASSGQESAAIQNPARTSTDASPSLSALVQAAGGTTTTATTAASKAPLSATDAYWAKQPAAVQQLRNIQDPTTRAETASELAQEGYSIDVPIMVWGWDPSITTAARQSYGYTWVPSALQQPVAAAPGLSFNGTSYNPSQPPAGSIMV